MTALCFTRSCVGFFTEYHSCTFSAVWRESRSLSLSLFSPHTSLSGLPLGNTEEGEIHNSNNMWMG